MLCFSGCGYECTQQLSYHLSPGLLLSGSNIGGGAIFLMASQTETSFSGSLFVENLVLDSGLGGAIRGLSSGSASLPAGSFIGGGEGSFLIVYTPPSVSCLNG